MSSSDAASSDSDGEDAPPPRRAPARRDRRGSPSGAPQAPSSSLLAVRARGGAAAPLQQPEPEPEPEPEPGAGGPRGPATGRLGRRREGISVAAASDGGGGADPLQDEARAKVRQAIVVNFPDPQSPKRQEMEMMLQFLQTMNDLAMFVAKYEQDLGELAKIQMDMQLKTMGSWKRKSTGLRAGVRLVMQMRPTGAEQDATEPWTSEERSALQQGARDLGLDVDSMTDEQIAQRVQEAQTKAREAEEEEEEEERKQIEANSRWTMMQRQLDEAKEEEAQRQAILALEEKARKKRARLDRLRKSHAKATALTRISGVPQTDFEKRLAALEAEELQLKRRLASGLLSFEEEEAIRRRLAEIAGEKLELKAALSREKTAKQDATRARLTRGRHGEKWNHLAAELAEFDISSALSKASGGGGERQAPGYSHRRPAPPGYIAAALVAEKSGASPATYVASKCR